MYSRRASASSWALRNMPPQLLVLALVLADAGLEVGDVVPQLRLRPA
eukprot:CAMPEP_0176145352 /NCGR_PEP_ID=MMETSP0120_2-20121206/74032_1 /TAXON_ID=160619 /ORGANISM="Kryptoperidinium foliaceum, Strain CCMP 1326" /LENGTH=46 /DNA_ID= /DNA_START= /DNA_END= /DNA_ORIENTATION=